MSWISKQIKIDQITNLYINWWNSSLTNITISATLYNKVCFNKKLWFFLQKLPTNILCQVMCFVFEIQLFLFVCLFCLLLLFDFSIQNPFKLFRFFFLCHDRCVNNAFQPFSFLFSFLFLYQILLFTKLKWLFLFNYLIMFFLAFTTIY